MALRAQRRRVIWMVQREVLVLCAAGLAVGLSIAWGAVHFVASFLFGVRPNDIAVFAAAAGILLSCALARGLRPCLARVAHRPGRSAKE
jgi:putative ABC transport system permease protein